MGSGLKSWQRCFVCQKVEPPAENHWGMLESHILFPSGEVTVRWHEQCLGMEAAQEDAATVKDDGEAIPRYAEALFSESILALRDEITELMDEEQGMDEELRLLRRRECQDWFTAWEKRGD